MTARSRDDGARSRREAAAHRVRGISFIVEPSRRELIEIGRLIDAGVARPIVESVLPLERAREAFERGLDGHNSGKLVLHVGNGSAVPAGRAMIP